MTECTNHRPWDTETPSHKISHDEYYEQWGTIDKIKHNPSMLQPRVRHIRITIIHLFTYSNRNKNKIQHIYSLIQIEIKTK